MLATYYTQERPVLALRYTGTNFAQLEEFFAGVVTDDGDPPALHQAAGAYPPAVFVTFGLSRDVVAAGDWCVVLNHRTDASAVVVLSDAQFQLACAPTPVARPVGASSAALVIERHDNPDAPADVVAIGNQLWASAARRAANIVAAPDLARLGLVLVTHERLP